MGIRGPKPPGLRSRSGSFGEVNESLTCSKSLGPLQLEKVCVFSCGRILVPSGWTKSGSSPVGKFWSFPAGKGLDPLLWENSGPLLLEKVWVLSYGKILVLSCWKKFGSSLVEKNVGPMSALGMPIKIIYGAKSFGTMASLNFTDKRFPYRNHLSCRESI